MTIKFSSGANQLKGNHLGGIYNFKKQEILYKCEYYCHLPSVRFGLNKSGNPEFSKDSISSNSQAYLNLLLARETRQCLYQKTLFIFGNIKDCNNEDNESIYLTDNNESVSLQRYCRGNVGNINYQYNKSNQGNQKAAK